MTHSNTTPISTEPRSDGPTPVHDVESLTKGGNIAQIVMDGQVYTLRITRQRKLILTK